MVTGRESIALGHGKYEYSCLIEDKGLDDFTIGVPLFGSDTGGLSFEDSCNAICEAMKAQWRSGYGNFYQVR